MIASVKPLLKGFYGTRASAVQMTSSSARPAWYQKAHKMRDEATLRNAEDEQSFSTEAICSKVRRLYYRPLNKVLSYHSFFDTHHYLV
jgi:hypothetical protein